MILKKDIITDDNPLLRKKCEDVKLPLSKEEIFPFYLPPLCSIRISASICFDSHLRGDFMMTFQEATSLFFSYLENNRGYSSLTIKNYRSDLAQFELFLNDQSLSFDELTRQDVRNYLFFLKKQNLQPSSVQRKLSCMRHFYHYLVSVHNFESNPFIHKT